MDFRPGGGIGTEEARSLTGMLRTALHETGEFTLINREDMEAIAENHRIELVFCDDDACLLKVGSLLGAQKLVAGDIGLVVDEFVVNARLVDIAGEALVNERVATRRSGQSALALQRAMTELAAELVGKSVASGMLPPEGGDRQGLDGRVYAVEGDRVLLDTGRWEGLKRGTVFEVLSPDADGRTRRPLGRVKVTEVFGSHSASECLGGLNPDALEPGYSLRVFRAPQRGAFELTAEYLFPMEEGQLNLTDTSRETIALRGPAVGASFVMRPQARFQLLLRTKLAWGYKGRHENEGSYRVYPFLSADEWVGSTNWFVGGALRYAVCRTRRVDVLVEAEFLNMVGHREPEGSPLPWLPSNLISLRPTFRFWRNRNMAVVCSAGYTRSYVSTSSPSRQWHVSSAGLQGGIALGY
jgi:hypothetical protein